MGFADFYVTLITHLQASSYLSPAAYALFVYDHIITFGDEVEAIWSQHLNLATLLFYLNRYGNHITLIIDQLAVDLVWPATVCKRFVRWEGLMTVIMVAIADTILILRVYCLYTKNKYILGLLLSFLATQIAVAVYGIIPGFPAPVPPPLTACVLTSSHKSISLVWAGPAVTDSVIFLLTLYKTLKNRTLRRNMISDKRGSLLDIMLRDGILYFSVVCAVNLMNVIVYFTAVQELKVMGAIFTQIVSAIMCSRLQINLRKSTLPAPSASQTVFDSGPLRLPTKAYTPRGNPDTLTNVSQGTKVSSVFLDMEAAEKVENKTFLSLGNLGEDIIDWSTTLWEDTTRSPL